MHGKIEFDTLAEMAEFLKEFVGSTAVFEARYIGHPYNKWTVTFTGGY